MAKRLLDLMLIIDIEATCWATAPPAGQANEIIEIGLCTLEVASGQRRDKRTILIKPERSVVSPFCTQLTTLTQEQVDQGISFAEACAMLVQHYASKERVWASYGEYDRTMFEKQCREQQIDYPFSTRHINIKTLFALMHALPREIGMASALNIVKIPLEGVHHRGIDDAWNIAALMSTLLQRARPS